MNPKSHPRASFESTSFRLAVFASAVLLGACGGDDDTDDATGATADPAVVEASAALSAQTLDDVRTGLDVDALLAGFGGRPKVLDALRSLVSERSPCADIQREDGHLTIDLGDGCTLPGSGRTVSGQLDLEVSSDEAQRSLDVSLVDFGAEVKATGTVHLEAESGARSRQISVQLSDGRALDWTGAATWAEGLVSFGGEATAVDAAGVSTSVVYAGFSWQRGDCYPSAGAATLNRGDEPTVVVTFDAETPDTGEVTVKVGRAPAVPYTLPIERCL